MRNIAQIAAFELQMGIGTVEETSIEHSVGIIFPKEHC